MWFQIWHEEFFEFSPNHAKIWKFDFDGLFLSKVDEVWAKTVILCDILIKNWINPDLVVSKMAWRNGWTFIRALKSLKNCTLMGSFCQKHIMFQLESFRGIIVSRHWRVLQNSTLMWVGFLGAQGVKLPTPPPPTCLKLVRIMLETWDLVCKYTHIYSFRQYIF